MPVTPISSSSILATSSSSEFDLTQWAERPTVENLYKDIDRYLPGHDLDKEIIVEPPAATMTALEKRLQNTNLKKSIRVVANEAHRNLHSTINIARPNDLFRRGSSKMWHRKVEQVKPGMRTSPSGEIPKAKKLRWIQGELIGKGSFGKVYHALNVEAGEWIAVKQVDLPLTKADFSNPQLRETKDALFREISLLEDLDNEYIVQYLGYDVDEDEGNINIFLEYVPGGSIASCLAKTGKFEDPLVRFFTRQILMGLAYLHNRNILHRDIKAGNILLDQHGTCKITDFGLSKLSGQDKAYDPHSNNSVMRGTVFWMAPEVVKGTNYNAKVDIWSLGCTVIEMLTGDHPWLDLNMLAALYSLGKYQPPPIPQGISEQARDFLSQCFIINPEDRPTAEELMSHPFVQQEDGFEFKVITLFRHIYIF
ncbi:kinase-like protein [Backusella circina FSU 941]|nr:kinase-like protein [Backusella circina FSU 941]